MFRRTLVPLAIVAMMTLTGMPMSAAQTTTPKDPVPLAPSINWVPQISQVQSLYAVYPDLQTVPTPTPGVNTPTVPEPDCTGGNAVSPAPALLLPTPKPGTYVDGNGNVHARAQCPYAATTAGVQPPAAAVAQFNAAKITRGFNLTANDSLVFFFNGSVPSGLTAIVGVQRNSASINSVRVPLSTSDGSAITTFNVEIPIPFNQRPYELRTGDIISLTMSVENNGGQVPIGNAPQWTMSDAGTHLAIRSSDAMRAATWTEDAQGNVRSLFKPYLDKSTIPPEGIPRIVGFFAVQSAFGLDMASGYGTVPTMTIVGSTPQPVPLGPNGDGVIPSSQNKSASSSIDGVAVYSFNDGLQDYRGLAAGPYNLTVRMPFFQGGAITFGTTAPILISSQSVALTPYDDSDPNTFPSPLESTAHTLSAGSTTTYLLLVNNTGFVDDTFRIDATPVSAAGWSITVDGPEVTNRQVTLHPHQSKIVTVTIGSPNGAADQTASIFQIVAVSTLDTNAKSTPVILTSTVTQDVTRDVGVITPGASVEVTPGQEQRIPVYVWNRGTRAENISLEVRETPSPGWTVALVQGGQTQSLITLSNVAPGAIASLDLSVTGPTTQNSLNHDITLNATDIDVGGVATERAMRLLLTATAGVHLNVLDEIGGADHTILTNGAIGSPLTGTNLPCTGGTAVPEGCGPPEGVNGALWRVLVTNTGRRGDTFDLSLDNAVIASSTKTTCVEQAFQKGKFGFEFRNNRGELSDLGTTTSIALSPNDTGEVYVIRGIDNTVNPMDATDPTCPPDTFNFTISAKGRDTQVVDRFAATVRVMVHGNAQNQGPDGPELQGALVESLARRPGYGPSSPYVDTSQLGHPQLVGGVEVNKTITYYVRVTDASNFAEYVDANKHVISPTMTVSALNFNRAAGWNVSIRNATDVVDPNLNPYTDKLTIRNDFGGNGPLQFIDREIEVRVTAPDGKNGTGLAGESAEALITAAIDAAHSSTLDVKTYITTLANVTIASDQSHIFAHPGESGAYLLYINNTGSTAATVTLRGGIVASNTQNAAAWLVSPASQTIFIPAQKNTTVALDVQPPTSATPGTTGDVNVSIEYARNPFNPSQTTNASLDLTTEVAARGALTLSTQSTEATTGPGGFANFSLSLQNTGTQPIDFDLTGTSLGNWTQTISPAQGTIQAGDTKAVVYVLKAPDDVVNDSRFSSIVRVVQHDNPSVFDIQTVNVNILGGKAIPAISVPKVQKTVDRNGAQGFEIDVKNLGTATGKIDFAVRSADPTWTAQVTDLAGAAVTSVTLDPNQLVTFNVTVHAPFTVPDHTLVPIEVQATNGASTAKVTLQALVHDFGVHIEMAPARLDAIAGLPTEWLVKIRNDGNDNDTLNVSADVTDIPDWRVDLAAQELRLEPGQEGQIKAVVKSPTNPLPTPRAYTLKFYVGTRGGQAVNLTKNESVAAIVNILNYRAIDVDKDDLLELAVDYDKNPANGFEKFVEIFPDGVQSTVVAVGHINGKTNFFLDVPSETRGYDGIADVWFDPETIYAYQIKVAADINNDNSPEYFLDTDRDGKIDKAFDAVSGQFWGVTEIKAFGDERIQYLIDTTGDGRPDRFYDPAAKIATRTLNVGDNNLVGLDTQNNGHVDKVYDIHANTVSDAKVYGFRDFATQYWYFFVIFIALVILTVMLVGRRRREI